MEMPHIINEFRLHYTVAGLCNAHRQCDQMFAKVGDVRLRQ